VIAFETLFLGLVVGLQPVGVAVGPQVAAVELRLDGAAVATLRAPPWATPCDFGPNPHPHVLEAIARDRAGTELGRARQWVNLPRPDAEANLFLERDPAGRVTGARLTWEHLEAPPERVRITLNGVALGVGDPHRFALPALDPARINVLSAELTFPGRVTARADIAFGGDLGDTTGAELTAVPLVLEPGVAMPSREDARDWFRVAGRPARVAAVEDSAADVVMVVDEDAAPLWTMQGRLLERSLARGAGFEEADPRGDHLELIFAVPRVITAPRGQKRSLFPSSPPLALRTRHLLARLCRITFPATPGGRQALAEAVAVAGLDAALGNRPRAVVLAYAGGEDQSRWNPDATRRFLTDLHVPLRVWALAATRRGETDSVWGPATNAGSEPLMDGALVALREQLARQRIVWLEGAHLPQRIELNEAARGVRLAR
jgi:hypothetical protein